MVFKNKKKKQIQPCPYSHNYPRDNPGYHLAGPPAFEAFPPSFQEIQSASKRARWPPFPSRTSCDESQKAAVPSGRLTAAGDVLCSVQLQTALLSITTNTTADEQDWLLKGQSHSDKSVVLASKCGPWCSSQLTNSGAQYNLSHLHQVIKLLKN